MASPSCSSQSIQNWPIWNFKDEAFKNIVWQNPKYNYLDIYQPSEKNDMPWISRSAGIILAIGRLILSPVEAALNGSTKPLKGRLYILIREFQGVIGKIVTLWNKEKGEMIKGNAEFHLHCYHHFLMSAKEIEVEEATRAEEAEREKEKIYSTHLSDFNKLKNPDKIAKMKIIVATNSLKITASDLVTLFLKFSKLIGYFIPDITVKELFSDERILRVTDACERENFKDLKLSDFQLAIQLNRKDADKILFQLVRVVMMQLKQDGIFNSLTLRKGLSDDISLNTELWKVLNRLTFSDLALLTKDQATGLNKWQKNLLYMAGYAGILTE